MNLIKHLTFAIVAIASLLFANCIDESYDLSKDIDMTITLGGDNLTFPGGSTDTISLKKILDLDEGEENTLKTNKGEINGLSIGDYYLKEDAEPKETYIDIQAASVKLGNEIEEKETLPFVNPNVIGKESIEELLNLNTSYKFHNEEIPSQLRKINWVELNEPTHLKIYFESDGIKQLIMKEGLKITFPKYITLANVSTEYYEASENVVLITKDTPFNKDGTTIDINIIKIDFLNPAVNDNFFIPDTDPKDWENPSGIIDLDINLTVRGEIAARSEDFNPGVLTDEATIGATIHFDNANILRGEVQIAPSFDVEIDPVDFVDIPEFLDDEETNIDLHDPKIFLHVNNTAPIGVNIKADMVGLDENGNVIIAHDGTPAKIQIGKSNYDEEYALYLPAQTQTVFAISRLEHSYGNDTIAIVVPNISNLVEKIPAQILVENVESTVPPIDYTIELDRRHTVTADYEFITPLAFGEHLNFVYRETFDGLSEDLEDIKIHHIELEMTTINEIPMEMSLKAEAVNTDGVLINNVSVSVDGKINAGKQGAPSNGNVKIVITSPTGEISNFDGINLVITGKCPAATEGTPLNEHQTLKLSDIKLRIKNGVTMDLN